MNGSPSPISIMCSAVLPASASSVRNTSSVMSALGWGRVSLGHIGQYRLHLAVVSTIYSTGSASSRARRVREPHSSFARFQALILDLLYLPGGNRKLSCRACFRVAWSLGVKKESSNPQRCPRPLTWSTTCKTRYEMELDASRRVRRGCYWESQVLRGRPVSPLKGFCCAPESQLLHSLNFQFSLFRIHFIMQSECPFRVPLHQFQNLIHRQCHPTEHQVRHHFGRTSHPYVPPSKLVLQSRVDPLH